MRVPHCNYSRLERAEAANYQSHPTAERRAKLHFVGAAAPCQPFRQMLPKGPSAARGVPAWVAAAAEGDRQTLQATNSPLSALQENPVKDLSAWAAAAGAVAHLGDPRHQRRPDGAVPSACGGNGVNLRLQGCNTRCIRAVGSKKQHWCMPTSPHPSWLRLPRRRSRHGRRDR